MSFGVFDTQLGAQGMEGVGDLRNCLAPLLPQRGPSHVLVFIVSNRVILLIDDIYKIFPGGFDLEHSRIFCGNFLTVIFPPMFDMEDILKECEGDLFLSEKLCTKK